MDSGNPDRSPKSSRRIRATLEKFGDATDTPSDVSRLAGGLESVDKIAIASFKNPEGCRRFQQRLLQAGIMSTLTVSRRESRVAVDTEDRGRAVPILQEHFEEFPDRWPDGVRRDHEFLILGTFILKRYTEPISQAGCVKDVKWFLSGNRSRNFSLTVFLEVSAPRFLPPIAVDAPHGQSPHRRVRL